MSARSPVALILGAGSNVGDHVGRAFAAKGYKIALAARSVKEEDSTSDKLLVRGDFADPESITSIFTKVQSQLGVPHVVIYNGMYYAFASIHKLTINQPLLLTSLEQRHLLTFL
jgi:NAD(P)-dependent dehydrogenase (short-subunit alcohol dehydrogenase family)